METKNRPQVHTIVEGKTYKALEVIGHPGTAMPHHYSTGEAAIMVKKGKALLKMCDGEHTLEMGSVFIIPAKKEHTLAILEEFEAAVIMAMDSSIQFI